MQDAGAGRQAADAFESRFAAADFVMDDFPEHRGSHGVDACFRRPDQGTSVTMHLEVEDCDAAVKRAGDAGAIVTMAPWDSFWGARYARIMDPFAILELLRTAAGEG